MINPEPENSKVFPYPVVNPWDNGPEVAEVQELLCAHGYKGRTEAAVRALQRQYGLKMDSIVGPKTWACLKKNLQPGCRVLRLGHTGADVYELQGLLQVHGHPVRRTGRFDDETLQAAISFQQRHHLAEEGQVGPITWTLLRGGQPLPQQPKPIKLREHRRWW
jgi:peptidoglycan hydrolase-like protein with peptidoglycan-binding domain